MARTASLLNLIFGCTHRYGFPRRYARYEGRRNVDVQTCSMCGAQRISPVQFGVARIERPEVAIGGEVEESI